MQLYKSPPPRSQVLGSWSPSCWLCVHVYSPSLRLSLNMVTGGLITEVTWIPQQFSNRWCLDKKKFAKKSSAEKICCYNKNFVQRNVKFFYFKAQKLSPKKIGTKKFFDQNFLVPFIFLTRKYLGSKISLG